MWPDSEKDELALGAVAVGERHAPHGIRDVAIRIALASISRVAAIELLDEHCLHENTTALSFSSAV